MLVRQLVAADELSPAFPALTAAAVVPACTGVPCPQNYSDYFKAFPEGTFMGKPSAGADSSGGKSKPKAVLIVKPRT